MKNSIIESSNGNVDITFDNSKYEYDSFTNRYYLLEYGTVNSPDGKLCKKRIGKKIFADIIKKVKESRNDSDN